jgi:hypothetical protein
MAPLSCGPRLAGRGAVTRLVRVVTVGLALNAGCVPTFTPREVAPEQDGSGPEAAVRPPADGSFFVIPDVAPASARDAATCGVVTVAIEKAPPELLLVFDRSSTMNLTVPGTGMTRWVAVTSAFQEVLGRTDAQVFWGLKVFPTEKVCGVAPGVDVDLGPGNAGKVTLWLSTPANRPGAPPASSGTPTDLAIDAAAAVLMARTSRNPKFLVLVTDDVPDCYPEARLSNMAVIDAIGRARAAGIPTFVFGIAAAGSASEELMNLMAEAGGRARPDPTRYYPVAMKDDMVRALTSIAAELVSCTFALRDAPPAPDDVTVTIDGTRVARDPTLRDGWSYGPAMGSVVVHGSACDRLKVGPPASVSIVFGCPITPIL